MGWRKMLGRGLFAGLIGIVGAVGLTGCASKQTDAAAVYEAIERKPGEPTIRIRIGRGVSESVVGGPTTVLATPIAAGGRITAGGSSDIISRVLESPVVVRLGEGGVVAVDGTGKRVSGASGVQITGIGYGLLTVDGADAPGTIWFHPIDGAIDVIEHVAMEAYLPGVLEKEVPPGWGASAYEAQAVAARSFALHERRRKAAMGAHFDVESTTVSQVYGGAVVEGWAHEAVRTTSGQVLEHNGELVRAYFSSTSGGRSSSAMDIWGVGGDGRLAFNASPALQVSDDGASRRTRADGSGWDSASPRYRWSAERLVGPLSNRIREYGAANGFSIGRMTRLTSIEVSERNPVGRPVKFSITDDASKTWTMPAEHLRWAMGAGDDVGGGSVWSSDFEATVSGSRVLISGRGWGHGVGLCQWSARGMAEAGFTSAEILSAFYPGARVTNAW